MHVDGRESSAIRPTDDRLTWTADEGKGSVATQADSEEIQPSDSLRPPQIIAACGELLGHLDQVTAVVVKDLPNGDHVVVSGSKDKVRNVLYSYLYYNDFNIV